MIFKLREILAPALETHSRARYVDKVNKWGALNLKNPEKPGKALKKTTNIRCWEERN